MASLKGLKSLFDGYRQGFLSGLEPTEAALHCDTQRSRPPRAVLTAPRGLSIEPLEMRPTVSFRNFSVDLSDQPTSPTSVAFQALREAIARVPVDLEELAMALEHARRADVDALLLQRGEEIFMAIIDKQGAVTRLATAIQNRMLKDRRSGSFNQKFEWKWQGMNENGRKTMNIETIWIHFNPFGPISGFKRRLPSILQELRSAIGKAEEVELGPNDYPAGTRERPRPRDLPNQPKFIHSEWF